MGKDCGCGGRNRKGSTQTYQHIGLDGEILPTPTGENAYTSEMDARMAAASQPGTRVRPVG